MHYAPRVATIKLHDRQIPAHAGRGPVTITLRMPEVTITDSEGRYIAISPQQADVVGGRMSDIVGWIDEGPES
jgi:hypothetical protein